MMVRSTTLTTNEPTVSCCATNNDGGARLVGLVCNSDDLAVHQVQEKHRRRNPRRNGSANHLFFVSLLLVILHVGGSSSSSSSSSSSPSSSHTPKTNNNPLFNPTATSSTPTATAAETLVPAATSSKTKDSKGAAALTESVPKKKKSKTTKKGAKKTKSPTMTTNNTPTTLSATKKPLKSSSSSSSTTTLTATQSVFIRRLQREWKDAVDMGIAYDWVRGKPIRRQTTKGKKKKSTKKVAIVNDVGNVRQGLGMDGAAMSDNNNNNKRVDQENESAVAVDAADTVENTVPPHISEDIASSNETEANTNTMTETPNDLVDQDSMENATSVSDTHSNSTTSTISTNNEEPQQAKVVETNTTTTTTCQKIEGGHICMGPLGSNLFVWHFSILGVEGSPYEGGIYHGRLIIPPQYPSRPPRVQVWTPSGRFVPMADICLSASAYHPESWNPSAWNLRTIIESLRLHFLTPANEIGGTSAPLEDRQEHARKSRGWVVQFETSQKRQRASQKITINHPAMIRQRVFPSLVVTEEPPKVESNQKEENLESNEEKIKVRNEEALNRLLQEASQSVPTKNTKKKKKKKKRQTSGNKQVKTATATARRSRRVEEIARNSERRSLVHDYKLLKSGLRLALLLFVIYWVVFGQ